MKIKGKKRLEYFIFVRNASQILDLKIIGSNQISHSE